MKFRIKIFKKIPKAFNIKEFLNEKASLNDYVEIYLFKSEKEMYKKAKRLEGYIIDSEEKRFIGRTLIGYREYEMIEENGKSYKKYSDKKGIMYFLGDNLTFEVISHEIFHFLIGYINEFAKNGLNGLKERNNEYYEDIGELFAYVSGRIANEIVRNYDKWVQNENTN